MWNETLLLFTRTIAIYGLIRIIKCVNDHFRKRADFNLRGGGRECPTQSNQRKFSKLHRYKTKSRQRRRRRSRARKSNSLFFAHRRSTDMRVSVFYNLFTNYLAGRVPCQPFNYQWSREHVIPKSIISNKAITENPRNIIPMPRELNMARSNRPYTIEWKDGYLKHACKQCPHPGYCRGSIVISAEGVHPPDYLKGPIARSILYSVDTYPKYAPVINDKVLKIDTAIRWDNSHPMSKEEKRWLDSLSL